MFDDLLHERFNLLTCLLNEREGRSLAGKMVWPSVSGLQVYNLDMYTSWFKNKPKPEEEENNNDIGEMPSQTVEEELSSRSTNFGMGLFLFMVFISFGFTALVLYFPSIGVPAAICGFPLAVILISRWILRTLF